MSAVRFVLRGRRPVEFDVLLVDQILEATEYGTMHDERPLIAADAATLFMFKLADFGSPMRAKALLIESANEAR